MDYAPVLDVHSNPANPIIGQRALDTAPTKVARLGAELIRGDEMLIGMALVLTGMRHFRH